MGCPVFHISSSSSWFVLLLKKTIALTNPAVKKNSAKAMKIDKKSISFIWLSFYIWFQWVRIILAIGSQDKVSQTCIFAL
jgi:hypothetical protein